jgi:hypothetical protein
MLVHSWVDYSEEVEGFRMDTSTEAEVHELSQNMARVDALRSLRKLIAG